MHQYAAESLRVVLPRIRSRKPSFPDAIEHDESRNQAMVRDAMTRESHDSSVSGLWTEAMISAAEELRTEGRQETLLEQLEAKFGSVDSSDRDRIASASNEQLVAWARRVVLDPVVDEVSRWESRRTTANVLRAEGRREILLISLQAKFGSLPPNLRARIDAAFIPQLKVWTRRVVLFGTIEEVFAD